MLILGRFPLLSVCGFERGRASVAPNYSASWLRFRTFLIRRWCSRVLSGLSISSLAVWRFRHGVACRVLWSGVSFFASLGAVGTYRVVLLVRLHPIVLLS